MPDLLITGARVLDPSRRVDARLDVLVRSGQIAAAGTALDAPGTQRIDAGGLILAPGFVDLHTHLRDPGFEYKETIATGTRAAARGGFTTVCCMPNTNPAIDSRAAVEYVLRRAEREAPVRVLPIGCITRGRAGRELAEFGDLAEAGVCAVSDDGAPVADAELMRRALEYSTTFRLTVIEHAEEPRLAGGVMHEGWVATRLGLPGVPSAAEEAAVQRDISLAELTGARLHVAHISTAGAVEMVRRAKAAGVAVTAEVTPHHLTLTHEAVLRSAAGFPYDTAARVNPPLRTPDDVAACLEGLLDGTIDAIATDHAPHAEVEKVVEFELAPNGISGLETAFGALMSLVHAGRLPLDLLVERLTAGPVRVLRLNERPGLAGLGSLAPSAPADLVLLDLEREWLVNPEDFASRGRNTPFAGRSLRGSVVATVAGGRIVWQDEARLPLTATAKTGSAG